ncbi:MAG: ABC transporter ATP-binding protein/permease [candidate division Zixibacteria bacterium]|nr:ABC transporter ATP-binding protein/permease [candidate division Zixibacteria bacterium]
MSAAENYHEEEALGKAYDARLMKRLLTYMRPYRLAMVTAVLLLFMSASAQISLAFVTQYGIDSFIEKGISTGFEKVALLYLGVIVLILGFSYGQIMVTVWLGQKVQHDLRIQIFRHLQRLNLTFFDRNPVGRLVTRVTNDVNTLNELFSSGVVAIIGDIFMLLLIVGAMLYVNWQLALITFGVLPALVVVTFVFRAKAREAYRLVRLKLARLNAFTQEHLTGVTLVQLFTQEKRVADNFEEINDDLRAGHHHAVIYYAMFYPTVEIIGAISIGLLMYYGGVRITGGEMTYGELTAFIFLVERFFFPIRDLSEKYNVLQSSMASSERIFNLLDTEPDIVDPPTPRPISKYRGRIDLENVWFAYKDKDWVLKDVSFSVEPGQRVAIVGATGAGKTSLVSLLYRFYDCRQGAIKIDGVPIPEMSLSDLRSHLALVLQDVFLFSGDYAGNVRLRNEDISDEAVRIALERVGFDRFLKDLPDGIHTEVKERGATLSTGQKQLLSFARALAYDPDILILDEATSSVDTATEKLIQEALETLLAGRTSIVIAHRLSTIEKADKIIVLHRGELREIGTHRVLLKKKGIYHTLYQMQYRRHQDPGVAGKTARR